MSANPSTPIKSRRPEILGQVSIADKFSNMTSVSGRIPVSKHLGRVLDLNEMPIADTPEDDRENALRYKMDYVDYGRYQKLNAFQKFIDRRLRAHGLTLETVGRINVVYVHNHPDNQKHQLPQQLPANTVIARLQQYDAVEAVRIDAIYQNEEFDDYKMQDKPAMDSLTAPQSFGFDPAIQEGSSALNEYARKDGKNTEFFIVVGNYMGDGTSLASLYSHIEQNGGAVLAAVSHFIDPDNSTRFAQKTKPKRFDAHEAEKIAPRHTMGRVPEMAKAFAESAAALDIDLAPDQCIELFDEGLSEYGMSAAAMTDPEVDHLLGDIEDGITTFPILLRDMGVKIPSP